eukprot:214473-Hanusia_phi.AAC.1
MRSMPVGLAALLVLQAVAAPAMALALTSQAAPSSLAPPCHRSSAFALPPVTCSAPRSTAPSIVRMLKSGWLEERVRRGGSQVAMTMDDARTRRSVMKDTLAVVIGAGLWGNASVAHAEDKKISREVEELRRRLGASELKQLPADFRSNSDIEYPAWLEGTWQVTARFDNFSTPLGVR